MQEITPALPSRQGSGVCALNIKTAGQEVLRQAYRMAQQGIPVPNPDLYKQWRDSAPVAGAESYRECLQEQDMRLDGTPLVG